MERVGFGAAVRGEVRDGWEDAAVAGALVTLRGGARRA